MNPPYDKAIKIIDSCLNLEQLIYAERYVYLFKQRYGLMDDHNFNQKIKKHIFIKKMRLKNGWINKD